MKQCLESPGLLSGLQTRNGFYSVTERPTDPLPLYLIELTRIITTSGSLTQNIFPVTKYRRKQPGLLCIFVSCANHGFTNRCMIIN